MRLFRKQRPRRESPRTATARVERARRLGWMAIVLFVLAAPAPARAGSLTFGTAPALPALPAITLSAHSQTTHATMTNFAVADTTGGGAGWNVTVNGNASAGMSAVFKQYCPVAGGCGADPLGYVTGGRTLPANSLTLNSTGASFTGTGTAPTLKCNAKCNVDSAAAVKVASAAVGAGAGTWTTTAFSATSLTLSTPTTLRTLPASEVYRVDVVWTLNTGP
jgi:WxL domain surface cell wall-binding